MIGNFTQHLYEKKKADIISAVEFDHTGDYLATGDKGGRVVLFERNESVTRAFGHQCIYQHP